MHQLGDPLSIEKVRSKVFVSAVAGIWPYALCQIVVLSDVVRVATGSAHHGLVQSLMIDGSSDFFSIYTLCFQEAEMVGPGV